MKDKLTPRTVVAIVVAIATLLSTIGVLTVNDDGTVIVHGVKLDKPAAQVYEDAVAVEAQHPNAAEADLSDETPEGTTAGEDPVRYADLVKASQRAANAGTAGDGDTGLIGPRPLATPEIPGCRTQLLDGNYGSRNGARQALGELHFTVSRNIPGWGDVDGIRAYFNRPQTQASSNFIIDFEGHCAYIVDVRDKSWTQGYFNPWSVSIEFIGLGNESATSWLASAGYRKGVVVMAHVARLYGIPARLADTDGCVILRSGIGDHDELGCGNSHTDIGAWPLKPFVNDVYRLLHPCDKRVATVEARLNARLHPKPAIIVGAPLGERAKAALKRFQRTTGLPASGTITNATVRALGLCH